MEEIGNLFLLTREGAGISLKEVSDDLSIDQAILENIEDGKTGAFPDVFALKDYIISYAKYLGLNADKMIDDFNEFMFEATSKIPVKEIERQIEENNKVIEDKVISPYTKKEKKVKNGLYLLVYIVLVSLLIVATAWSVKQVTINNKVANAISYGG